MQHLRRSFNLCLLIFVLLGGSAGHLAPVHADPRQQGETDLEALAALVEVDNLQWENITFWHDSILGDDAMADLMLGVELGAVFPDISLEHLNDTRSTITADGQPTLINFWATWCPPCRLEMPLLLAAHHDPRASFDVVFANVWDDPVEYKTFIQDEFPENALVGIFDVDAMPELGLAAVPVTVLLDRDHTLLLVHVGNVTQTVMEFLVAVAETSVLSDLPGMNLDTMSPSNPVQGNTESMVPVLERANQASGSATMWFGGQVGIEGEHFHGVEVGEKFPAFGLVATNGETVLLDRLDRPVLLNFWASWCGPCVAEFPILIAAHDDPDAIYDVVFVNIWDDPYSFQEFLEGYPDALTVVRDADGKLPDLYTLDFIPMNFLVNEMGIVELIQYGPVNDVVMDFMALIIED